MREIIDYAGLFPPARLPLDEALREYQAYRSHPHSAFLARFVMPLDRLMKVTNPAAHPWRFSGLVRASSLPVQDARAEIDRCVAGLRFFEVKFPRITTDAIELDLPEGAWNEENDYRRFRDFLSLLTASFTGRRVFIELDWRKPYAPLMALMAQAGPHFGAKLRMGGNTPDLTPPSPAVASFLLAAAAAGLPLKATAGLHVPTPNEDVETGALMHGFFNFFCAGFLAYSGRGGQDSLIEVLEEYGYEDFCFKDGSLRFGSEEFTAEEISRLREQWLLSFGSCSFLEPVEHLQSHGLI
ncbi:MAG TPA: hypothetical protein VL285_23960 [Bryobacteraceae bacterium]|jgi:hypothetical protein|nr:hypothetical protein [Bryobacteraceae bacterium]